MQIDHYLIIILLAICKLPDFIGFTESGIKYASLASQIQSMIKLIEKGSTFATFQSLAMRGIIKGICYESAFILTGYEISKLHIVTSEFECPKNSSNESIGLLNFFCAYDGNEQENYKYLIEYINTKDPNVNLMLKATEDLLKLMKNYLALRVNGMKLEFIDEKFDGYNDKINQFKDKIEEVLNATMTKFLGPEKANGYMDKLKNTMESINKEVKNYNDKVTKFLGRTKEQVKIVGGKIANEAEGVYNKVANATEGVYNKVANEAEGVYNKVANATEGVYNKIANATEGAYNKIANATEGAYNKIANEAEGVYNKIKNIFI